jgi:hypothetical protein
VLTPHGIFKELGLAFSISCILGLTLDGISRKNLLAGVVEEVAPYLLSYGSPREIGHELKFIRNVHILRENVKVSLRFTRSAQGLELETMMSYTVVNYSDRPGEFRHYVEIFTTGKVEDHHLVEVSASGLDLGRDCYHKTFPRTGKVEHRWDAPRMIPSNSANPQNRFEYRIRRALEEENGGDVLFLPEPGRGLEVTLTAIPDNLRLHQLAIGIRNPERIVRTPPPPAETRHWGLKARLLPPTPRACRL